MNGDKLKNIYRTVMLIIVVALITFVITSAFLYNKLTNMYLTFITHFLSFCP